MASKILDNRTPQSDRNVRPSHTRHGHPIELILLPLPDILEVEDAGVVVVLAREDGVVDVGWVYVGECVLMGVPPTEAHIETTHEGDLAVDEAQFLMMSPV